MTTRGQKRSGERDLSTAPLKGALVEDNDPQSVALAMLMKQLESMESQRRLETQALQSALTANNEQVKNLQLALAEEKRQTAEALEMLHGKMVEIMESRPVDPKTQQEMIKVMRREAKEEHARRQREFIEYLKTCKTGTIRNPGPAKKFIINGVPRVIKPGLNRKVPHPFVDAWKKQDDLKEWAQAVDRGFQSYEHMQDANSYNMRRGAQPFWDEKVGMVG